MTFDPSISASPVGRSSVAEREKARQGSEPSLWERFTDWLAKGVASVTHDVRQKLVEEGWFSKTVTPRATSITLGSAGEQSPAEKLGWETPGEKQRSPDSGFWPREARGHHDHDREMAAKEPKSPDRGIDL